MLIARGNMSVVGEANPLSAQQKSIAQAIADAMVMRTVKTTIIPFPNSLVDIRFRRPNGLGVTGGHFKPRAQS
jgi:GMP synthase-like glutamine amidotransferase